MVQFRANHPTFYHGTAKHYYSEAQTWNMLEFYLLLQAARRAATLSWASCVEMGFLWWIFILAANRDLC